MKLSLKGRSEGRVLIYIEEHNPRSGNFETWHNLENWEWAANQYLE